MQLSCRRPYTLSARISGRSFDSESVRIIDEICSIAVRRLETAHILLGRPMRPYVLALRYSLSRDCSIEEDKVPISESIIDNRYGAESENPKRNSDPPRVSIAPMGVNYTQNAEDVEMNNILSYSCAFH